MRFCVIFSLVQISFFGTVLGRFFQCNYKIFCRRPNMAANTFTQCPLTIRKLSTALKTKIHNKIEYKTSVKSKYKFIGKVSTLVLIKITRIQ